MTCLVILLMGWHQQRCRFWPEIQPCSDGPTSGGPKCLFNSGVIIEWIFNFYMTEKVPVLNIKVFKDPILKQGFSQLPTKNWRSFWIRTRYPSKNHQDNLYLVN